MVDLTNEQRAVYRAILPSTFSYTFPSTQKDLSTNQLVPITDAATLTPEQESEVKFHLFTRVTLRGDFQEAGSRSSRGSWGVSDTDWSSDLHRTNSADEDTSSLYGVPIRKTLANRGKPTDLEFGAHEWDAPISLGTSQSIANLCKAISMLTGRTILADERVESLPVFAYGASARAGDVLQALALCVTGTYRKVGGVFVLTSGIEGIETQRLRLALWRWDIEEQAKKKVQKWKEDSQTSNGAQQPRIDSEKWTMNSAKGKFLRENRLFSDQLDMAASELSPDWKAMYDRIRKDHSKGNVLAGPNVTPTEILFWNFNLPDHRPLSYEAGLGDLKDFRPSAHSRQVARAPSSIEPASLESNTNEAIAYKTQDPDVAASLPKLIREYGFKELWIQTDDSTCLSKAIEAGTAAQISVRLMIKPWEAPSDVSGKVLDRTLLGQSAREAFRQRTESTWWKESRSTIATAPLPVQDLLPPGDPSQSSRWNLYARLAASPGLA